MTMIRTLPWDSTHAQTFGQLTNGDADEDGVKSLSGVAYPTQYTMRKASETKDTNPKDAIGIRKAPMSTIPGNVLAEMGVAMLEGASKYGRHNYRAAGVRASVYYDAAMRHLIAWWEGEDIDPDSGMSHITKLLACMAVLRDAMHQEMWEDDRPPRSKPFYQNLNTKAGFILDLYSDKQPRHYTIKDSKGE